MMNFVLYISHHDFEQSDSVFQTQCSIFEDDESHLAYFQSYKSNDWLVNIISTEQDQ